MNKYSIKHLATSRAKTSEAQRYHANQWSLCDMSGNVFEWCLDDWHSGYKNAPPDERRWGNGETNLRIRRSDLYTCRTAYRNHGAPDFSDSSTGFRVCLQRKQKTPK